jgi:hypothetical protein
LGAAYCRGDGYSGGARHGEPFSDCDCRNRINQEGYALQYHLSRFGDDSCHWRFRADCD